MQPLPLPVARALVQLGQHLEKARRRRGMTQAMLAERIGASVKTVQRLEEGSSGIALQHLLSALQVFGELDKLTSLMQTSQDSVGLALMDEKLPKRVQPPRKPNNAF